MRKKTLSVIIILGSLISSLLSLAQDVFPAPPLNREVISPANASQVVELGRVGLGEVVGLAWSPQNNSIVAVALTSGVRLYDVTMPESPPHLLPYDGWSLSSVAFAPDGTQVAAGDEKGFVYIWDIETGMQRLVTQAHISVVQAVAFSPDGRLFASAGDQEIRFWDVETLVVYPSLNHISAVTSMAFLPNSQQLVSAAADTTLRLWDIATRRAQSVVYFNDPIGALAISPDGAYVVASNTGFRSDHALRGWELEARQFGTELEDLSSISSTIVFDAQSDDVTLSFGSDGQLLLAGGQGVALWDRETGGSLVLYKRPGSYAALSPDGTFAVFTEGKRLEVFLAATSPGSELQSLIPITGSIFSLAFADNGQSLLTVSNDVRNGLRKWDLRTGVQTILPLTSKEYREIVEYPQNCGYDCETLTFPTQDKAIMVFAALPCNEGAGQALLSPDRSIEAVCLDQSQGYRIVFLDAATHIERTGIDISDNVDNFAFSPDSTRLLVVTRGGQGRAGRTKVIDTLTGKQLFTFQNSARLSPDGSVMAIKEQRERTNWIVLYDAFDGSILHEMMLPPQTDSIHDIEFSPDGTLLVAIAQREVYLWGIPVAQ